MVKFENVRFEGQVNVAENAEFVGCEFAAQGADKNAKVFGVEVKNGAALTIKDSKFMNQGYSAVHMCSNGDVLLAGNHFDCVNVYNPIEGAVSEGSTKNIVVKDCEFEGACGNNYFNLYRMDKGSEVELSGNKFVGCSANSEIIRISNPLNVAAHIKASNEEYGFADPENVNEYTSYIMCQDYTAKSGNKQDFTKIAVDMENVKCQGERIVNKPAVGVVSFTYEDGKGIIEGNDPVINIK